MFISMIELDMLSAETQDEREEPYCGGYVRTSVGRQRFVGVGGACQEKLAYDFASE